MTNFTISIFGNKSFSEILNEMELFSKYKIKYYEDCSLCVNDAKKKDHIVVFFVSELNMNFFDEINKNNFPLIFVGESLFLKNILLGERYEQLSMPFTILDFKKKVIIATAKYEFKKNSLINLSGYIIDKNERKIKKNNLELQLSEKEINFLILFSENKKPISRSLVLKNVWNYSSYSETHTVETHIHRLRKKILEKFGDNNFIKNNNMGYYI